MLRYLNHDLISAVVLKKGFFWMTEIWIGFSCWRLNWWRTWCPIWCRSGDVSGLEQPVFEELGDLVGDLFGDITGDLDPELVGDAVVDLCWPGGDAFWRSLLWASNLSFISSSFLFKWRFLSKLSMADPCFSFIWFTRQAEILILIKNNKNRYFSIKNEIIFTLVFVSLIAESALQWKSCTLSQCINAWARTITTNHFFDDYFRYFLKIIFF